MSYTLIYKYFIGREVWFIDDNSIKFGKIIMMDSSVSEQTSVITYIILNGDLSYTISEDLTFSTAQAALQYIIDARN